MQTSQHVRGSGFCRTLRGFLAPRGKDGEYRKLTNDAWDRLLRNPCPVNLKIYGVQLLRMAMGDRLLKSVVPDRAVVVTGVYTARGRMYHFAPVGKKKQILSVGLRPRQRYVFLTDDPHAVGQLYVPWKKNAQLGKETSYTLLEIDTKRLMKAQKIFRTDREHEYVTGKIDAQYIRVAPGGIVADGTK